MTTTSTGISGLDKLMGGGFPKKTSILVSGGPGSGKTLVGMNFLLDGARKGRRCCYVSLNETKEELLRACRGIASLSDIQKYEGKNLAIQHISIGGHMTIKKFVEMIGSYPRIDRLVIDNVNKMFMFSENDVVYRNCLMELIKNLKKFDGCNMILCETTSDDAMDSGRNEAFEVDGVVQLSFLDLEEKPIRTLSIHKMRYASFDPKVSHGLVIDSKGIKLSGIKSI